VCPWEGVVGEAEWLGVGGVEHTLFIFITVWKVRQKSIFSLGTQDTINLSAILPTEWTTITRVSWPIGFSLQQVILILLGVHQLRADDTYTGIRFFFLEVPLDEACLIIA
jgi:hypothetical protein